MAPTISAELCYCGTEMRYQGINKNSLYCPHCDRACTIQRDIKESCIRCEDFKAAWADKIDEIYGPGRAA